MKTPNPKPHQVLEFRPASAQKATVVALAIMVLSNCVILVSRSTPAQAACPPLDTSNGTVTQTVTIPSSGAYTIWSRIMAPDSTKNSYYLEIDSTSCGLNVGDSAITANAWTWVDYQGGQSATKVNLSLTSGAHTIKMVGRESGVKLDRILFLSDSCVPTGTGDNCATASDTTAPTITLTAPSNGASVNGSVNVTANSADNIGVIGVQFKLDGSNLGAEDTVAPYSVSWDTTAVPNGSHVVSAVARDAASNTTASTINLSVNNATSGGTYAPIYRLANYITKERLFTSSSAERDSAVASQKGWISEAVAFYVPSNGTVPIYRLANYLTHERLFTTSLAEKNSINGKNGWVYEQVAFQVLSSDPTPVYRLANYLTHERLFTTSLAEKNSINGKNGWVYEQVSFQVK